MERWLSSFSFKASRRTRVTQSQPENMEIAGSMADPQSSSSYTDDSEELTRHALREDNIIQNPCFENGLNSWSGRGCKISLHSSIADGRIKPFHGSFFASATERSQSWNGLQQDITGKVQRKVPYEVTAVVCSLGSVSVDMGVGLWVKSPNGREQYISIATCKTSENEWVKLQGKFLLNGVASKASIYLAGPPTGTGILVNSLIVKQAKKQPPPPPPSIKNVPFGVNIIRNSNLDRGLNGWSPLGTCSLRVCSGSPTVIPEVMKDSVPSQQFLSGHYILSTNRTETWMGPSQTITDRLRPHVTYQTAAWVSFRSGADGPQTINVTLHVDDRWITAGQVLAVHGRWNEVGGAFRLDKQPSKATLYVSGPAAGVDLMVTGLHVFAVDQKARFEHLKEKTDKVRKRDIILKFPRIGDNNFVGASVKVRQMKNSFAFGSHINWSLIENEEFVNFLLKNFSWAVFGNELKWYATEPEQGKLSYKDADKLLEFCNRHGLKTRGHCIFWEVEDTVQPWIRSLSRNDLMKAVQNRLTGLLSRYRGKFVHHDVNNEMLHGSFYRDRLGEDIGAYMFRETHRLDPSAVLFVNDYNVEGGCDLKATPEMYVNQVLDLQEQGAQVGGVGLQGHISHPVGAILCGALDKLGVLGLPIWLTEFDVDASNEHVRADDMEVVLREAYAHPSVEGVMLWGHLECHCRENTQLIDADGGFNEAGRRFLALKEEWLSRADGHVDGRGEFRMRGYHGEYVVEVATPRKEEWSRSFAVDKGETPLALTIPL